MSEKYKETSLGGLATTVRIPLTSPAWYDFPLLCRTDLATDDADGSLSSVNTRRWQYNEGIFTLALVARSPQLLDFCLKKAVRTSYLVTGTQGMDAALLVYTHVYWVRLEPFPTHRPPPTTHLSLSVDSSQYT